MNKGLGYIWRAEINIIILKLKNWFKICIVLVSKKYCFNPFLYFFKHFLWVASVLKYAYYEN